MFHAPNLLINSETLYLIHSYSPHHVLVIGEDAAEDLGVVLHLLLELGEALLDGQQPLEAVGLRVGLDLLEDHLD